MTQQPVQRLESEVQVQKYIYIYFTAQVMKTGSRGFIYKNYKKDYEKWLTLKNNTLTWPIAKYNLKLRTKAKLLTGHNYTTTEQSYKLTEGH